MKLNKSILTTALVASSIALAACNEKNKTETNQTPTTEQAKVETAKPVEPTATSETQNNTQTDKQELLNQFNDALNIKLVGHNIGKTDQGEDVLSFIYTVENKGNKAIKEIQWFNIVALDSAIIDVIAVPATFEKALAAQESGEVTLTKLAKNYPENVRVALLNPETNLQFSQTVAGKVVFEDGSQLVITTLDDIANFLQQVPKQ